MSLPDDTRAIYEGVALGALEPRLQIAVAGTERASYLQGLLTNDILALTPGTGCYAAWLTPQGRMLTDLHVLESGESILLDVPAAQAASTLARLDQFLFSEDVQLAKLDDDLASVWLHGPASAELLAGSLETRSDPRTWTNYQLGRAALADTPIMLARIDQLGPPGFCAYMPPAVRDSFEAAVLAAGAVRAGAATLEAARIEAGYPLFGVDMTDDTIPLEAGLEGRAISLTKGCYVGQEVIIRVLHRGHGRVARRLVGLRADGELRPGARVHAGDRDIGFVTSAISSVRLGTVVALGYVHRDFVTPGTSVVVRAAETQTAATVMGLPM